MTKDQIEQKIAELHEKAFALQKEIEEVERESVNMKDMEEWPTVNDSYFYITRSGKIVQSIFNCAVDLDSKNLGNCFRSQKKTEFYVERLKVLAEMRKFALEQKFWDGCHVYFSIFYNHFTNEILITNTDRFSYGEPFFESKDVAKSCISAIGEERLKKYYFGGER